MSLVFQDAHQRTVSYLRFSITDRCNLRCIYCRGVTPEAFLSHKDILTYQEIIRLVRITKDLGVTKVRLTGGEPFARLGCHTLILSLRKEYPDLNIRLTSNGTLLAPYIPALVEAKIDAVNLSIDSFRRETFAKTTRSDSLHTVLDVLYKLLEAGIRVKVNSVALKGINDQEMPDFLKILKELPIDLRFIEFMPMGQHTIWKTSMLWTGEEILAEAARYAELSPSAPFRADHGPARMYALSGYKGRLGIISALSNHYCASCNRMRVTSDGKLRTCLFDDTMIPLRPLLRDPQQSDEQIKEVICQAMMTKPLGVEILNARKRTAVATGTMDSIGG